MYIIKRIRLFIKKRKAIKQNCNIIKLGKISSYDSNNLNKDKKTVGYIFITDSNQKEKEMMNMINMIKKYAKENNLEISRIYIDKILDGKNLNKRCSLKKLLKETKKKEIGQVIVPMIEDISKDCIYAQKVLDTLNSKNVKIVCAIDGLILG